MDAQDLMSTVQQIKEIADKAVPKITDISAKDQVQRIGDIADAAIRRNQPKAESQENTTHGG